VNIPQRIVLIVAVVVLWIILTHIEWLRDAHNDQVWDWQMAFVLGGFWCLTVAAIYFATGKKKCVSWEMF
jgi:hypothetical protein